jgi:hypothetical protein
MPFIHNRTRKAIKRDYEDAAHAFALSPILLAALFLVAALIAVGIWLWTASSGARGNASVTRQHNSGQNQVAQNTKLLGDQATVLSDQQKIQSLAGGVVTEQDRMDLSGLELNCQSDVAAYNADVRNILASGYLPAGLPSSYPAAACDAPTSK